jgi:hypothetical protein
MAPSRIPYPDRGQGIFFGRLLPLSASVSAPGVNFLDVGKAESRGVEAGFQVLLPWQLRLDGQRGSPWVTLPGYPTIGLSGSYAIFANVWHMRSLRSQMKIANLLDGDYEQVLGFSQPGIRVRGGVTVNFCANDRHTEQEHEGGYV